MVLVCEGGFIELNGSLDNIKTSVANNDVAHALVVALMSKMMTADAESAELLDMLKSYWGDGAFASVTYSLTNCTSSNNTSHALINGTFTTTITADAGYEINYAYAIMGGDAYQAVDGVITINSVTGDISVMASTESRTDVITDGLIYRWVGSDANISADGDVWYDQINNLGITIHGSGATSNGQAVCFDGTSGTYGTSVNDGLFSSSDNCTVEIVFNNNNTSNGLVGGFFLASNQTMGIGLIGSNMYGAQRAMPYYPDMATNGKQVVTVRRSQAFIKNGVTLSGSGDNMYNCSLPNIGMFIGSRDSGSASIFIGDIYEIRVYKAILFEEAVQHNHSIDIARYGIEV